MTRSGDGTRQDDGAPCPPVDPLPDPLPFPRPVRGVLFDLDNTLADRDGAFRRYADWFVRERLGLTATAAIEAVTAVMLAHDQGGYGDKAALFVALRRHSPHPYLETSPADLLAEFRAQMARLLPPLSPGAAELLAALDAAGRPWGIVTNGAPTQRDRIAQLGLATRARVVVISDEVGWRKPEPAIFAHAAAALDLPPAAILFVGDHPANDIAGARAAGMMTAWLRHGAAWPATLGAPPALTLDDLGQLHAALLPALRRAAPPTR